MCEFFQIEAGKWINPLQISSLGRIDGTPPQFVVRMTGGEVVEVSGERAAALRKLLNLRDDPLSGERRS